MATFTPFVKKVLGMALVKSTSVKEIKELIEAGTDINFANVNKDTALTLAAYLGNLEIVEVLIKAKADIEAKDKDGRTALMKASQLGHLEIVEALIQAKADVNAQDEEEFTSMMLASDKGHDEIVKVLIQAKADVHMKNDENNTALAWASREGFAKTAKLLVKAGADVNAKNIYGWTPLMQASCGGHTDTVKFLIRSGADIKAVNNVGLRASKITKNDTVKNILYQLKDYVPVKLLPKTEPVKEVDSPIKEFIKNIPKDVNGDFTYVKPNMTSAKCYDWLFVGGRDLLIVDSEEKTCYGAYTYPTYIDSVEDIKVPVTWRKNVKKPNDLQIAFVESLGFSVSKF
jgi:ankyrin repeat protein